MDNKEISYDPVIKINDYELEPSMVMTIRVALESFDQDLANRGLGVDDHAKAMTAGYRANIDALRNALYPHRRETYRHIAKKPKHE